MLSLFAFCVKAQHVTYSPFAHYTEKVDEFEKMRDIGSHDIVMLGNSITEYAGDWNVLLHRKNIRNRGIAGDDAMGIYHRLCQILPGKPAKIFLMVGINDVSHNLSISDVASLCEKVINKIHTDCPETKLYVQSILPINEDFGVWKKLEGKTNNIHFINARIKRYCRINGITYIDVYSRMTRRGTNQLRRELSVDGLHLSPQGYKIWAFELKRYLK